MQKIVNEFTSVQRKIALDIQLEIILLLQPQKGQSVEIKQSKRGEKKCCCVNKLSLNYTVLILTSAG